MPDHPCCISPYKLSPGAWDELAGLRTEILSTNAAASGWPWVDTDRAVDLAGVRRKFTDGRRDPDDQYVIRLLDPQALAAFARRHGGVGLYALLEREPGRRFVVSVPFPAQWRADHPARALAIAAGTAGNPGAVATLTGGRGREDTARPAARRGRRGNAVSIVRQIAEPLTAIDATADPAFETLLRLWHDYPEAGVLARHAAAILPVHMIECAGDPIAWPFIFFSSTVRIFSGRDLTHTPIGATPFAEAIIPRYVDSVTTGQPLYDKVLMQLGPVREVYTRLLLPAQAGGRRVGERLVVAMHRRRIAEFDGDR